MLQAILSVMRILDLGRFVNGAVSLTFFESAADQVGQLSSRSLALEQSVVLGFHLAGSHIYSR